MANRIDRVTTKTGDTGYTSLADGERYTKHDDRIELVGCLDEANATLAVLLAALPTSHPERSFLGNIQNRLFDAGAAVATGYSGATDDDALAETARTWAAQTERLDRQIQAANATLAPLTEFVIPGGSTSNAAAHMARAQVRRAERAFWRADIETLARAGIGVYLNRLSDYLFVCARTLVEDENVWKPLK